MNTSSQPSNDKLFVARALEATIHKCTTAIGERRILAGHRRTFIQVLESGREQSWSCPEQDHPAA
jgi:hypothetical protein